MSQHDHETHACIDVEALGAVVELAADDPVRREAEACPRCAARLQTYREFLSEAEVEGARKTDARVRLDAFRAARIEAPVLRSAGEAPSRFGSWWRRLGESRALRPALVAAAAVLVAGAVWWQPWQSTAPVLRGGGQDAGFAIESVRLAGGALEVAWSAFVGADAYEVRLFAMDLTDVARFGPVAETHLSIPVDDILSRAPGEHSLLCSVAALSAGDEVAVSAPESVDLR
jgi:hypothetical protein